jgi:c-di-GMP-binding flagellar brake protein YcgR
MSINNRKHKRSLFTPGKWVRLIENTEGSYAKSYMIVDISIGGIGIISTRKGEFRSGTQYYILDIDGHPPEKKIKLEIKYVNLLEGQDNKYRAGCEFVEITTLDK